MAEFVILVDPFDNETGLMEKMEAHRKALLHRAVSAFILNSQQQLLLQKRAPDKYHSPELWTNTVCTHPKPDESNTDAVIRRLQEEMGLAVTNVKKIFDFTYREKLDNELTEHEFDHVFIGFTDELPLPNPAEVSDYMFIDIDKIRKDVEVNPQNYTVWFLKIIHRVLDEIHPDKKYST